MSKMSMEEYEDGRLSRPRIKWITHIFSLLTVAGLTAGSYAAMVGHQHAYGISREIPWGILTSSFAFFAITSTGLCLLAAISHAYGVMTLAPLSSRAVYLSIVTTITAFMLLAFGVENPGRLIYYNAASPNLTSNIWWMCTLYGIMSGCLFLRFAFLMSGSRGLAIGIGIVAAVAGVGANNNIGGLFTIASDPPIWYGAQLLILFLTSAVMSGAAVIIVFTLLAYKIRKQKIVGDELKAVHTAGTILALTLAILIVVTVSRYTSMFFGSSPEPGRVAAIVLLKGSLAFNFWVIEVLIGLVIPLLILVISKVKDLRLIAVAGWLALAGGFCQRFDLVIAGQIVPKFSGWYNQPVYQSYYPFPAEIIVVVGAFSLVGLGFLLGERFIGRVFRLYP